MYAFSPARLASPATILIATAALLAVALMGNRIDLTGAGPPIPTIQRNVPPAIQHDVLPAKDQPPSLEAPARDAWPSTIQPAAGGGYATKTAPPPAPTMLSGSSSAGPVPMVTPSRWSEPVEDGPPALAPPPQTNPKSPPLGSMGQ